MQLPSWLRSLVGTRSRPCTPCSSVALRRGTRLELECLETRMALSSGRGGADIFLPPSANGPSGGASFARLDNGEQHGGGLVGGASLHPSGPGYPLPPTTGPALRGDTLKLVSVSGAPLNLPRSDVAIVPVLVAAAPGGAGPAYSINPGLSTAFGKQTATDAPPLLFTSQDQRTRTPADGKEVAAAAKPVPASVTDPVVVVTSTTRPAETGATSVDVFAPGAAPLAFAAHGNVEIDTHAQGTSPIPVSVADAHVWTKLELTVTAVGLAAVYVLANDVVRTKRKAPARKPALV